MCVCVRGNILCGNENEQLSRGDVLHVVSMRRRETPSRMYIESINFNLHTRCPQPACNQFELSRRVNQSQFAHHQPHTIISIDFSPSTFFHPSRVISNGLWLSRFHGCPSLRLCCVLAHAHHEDTSPRTKTLTLSLTSLLCSRHSSEANNLGKWNFWFYSQVCQYYYFLLLA